MIVSKLELTGFRNYERLCVDFSPEMNLIRGENAQGKTNLVEAIAYLSTAKSHRARADRELIGFDQSEARILAEVQSRGREFQMDLTLRRSGRRSVSINHIKRKTLADLSGVLHTVLFCPEDLALVKEGAAVRRRFLDRAICQLRPKYAEALARYQRLLEHKTRILRDSAEKPSLLSVLEEFDEGLARCGALLVHYRAHFIRRLFSLADDICRDFSGARENLRLHYDTVSSIDDPFASPADLYTKLRAHQASHRQAELAARLCLSGPHKDDLVAFLNDQPARQFASQGQTRSLALSLKLAERALFFEDVGQWPVLLLDDVLSELDAKRQAFVLERIRGGQVFLTGCEVPSVQRTDYRCLTIAGGQVLEET